MVLGRGLEPLKSDYKSEILPIKLTQQVRAFLIKVTKSVNAHYSCAVFGMVVVVVALLIISVITALLHRVPCYNSAQTIVHIYNIKIYTVIEGRVFSLIQQPKPILLYSVSPKA